MLKIHGIARSRAFRCIWAAEEAGLAYEVIPLGFAPGFKLERPLAINPNNKIPALEDGDLVLFESLAINLHIAGKVGVTRIAGAYHLFGCDGVVQRLEHKRERCEADLRILRRIGGCGRVEM